MKYYILTFIFAVALCGSFLSVNGQNTSKADSVAVAKKKELHSPRKATLYSAVLPGLGQVYNKKYYKLPFIYGGFVAFGYFIDYYNKEYIFYKQAYSDITDSDPKTDSYLQAKYVEYVDFSSSSSVSQYAEKLKKARDGSRRYRDLDIIGTVAFYAINIIDASVDAHFFNFDISDDLSMSWMPQPMYCMDNRILGVRCRLKF